MVDELYAFVQHAYAATPAPSRPGQSEMPNSRTVSVDGTLLNLYYNESGRKLWLMADGTPSAESDRLVEKIGHHFDAELARGKHQGLVAEYPSSD
jgi:hypothetical protein